MTPLNSNPKSNAVAQNPGMQYAPSPFGYNPNDLIDYSDKLDKKAVRGMDYNYIFGSNLVRKGMLGLANLLPNSTQNAILRYNQDQSNPINYLPENPNVSQQDLYGDSFMQYGGQLGENDEGYKFIFGDSKQAAPQEQKTGKPQPTQPQQPEEDNFDYSQLREDDTPTRDKFQFDLSAVQQAFDEENNSTTSDDLYNLTGKDAFKNIDSGVASASEVLLNMFPTLRMTSGRRTWGDKDAHPLGRAVDISGNAEDLKKAYDFYSKNLVPQYGFNQALPLNHGTGPHIHVGYYQKGGKISNAKLEQDMLEAYMKYNPNLVMAAPALNEKIPNDSIRIYPFMGNRTNFGVPFVSDSTKKVGQINASNALLFDMYNKGLVRAYVKEDGGEVEEEMKSGGWIKNAVNPAHKGFCTPMTKSTCTPRRKAFARRAKAHFKEEGGLVDFQDGGSIDLSKMQQVSIPGNKLNEDQLQAAYMQYTKGMHSSGDSSNGLDYVLTGPNSYYKLSSEDKKILSERAKSRLPSSDNFFSQMGTALGTVIAHPQDTWYALSSDPKHYVPTKQAGGAITNPDAYKPFGARAEQSKQEGWYPVESTVNGSISYRNDYHPFNSVQLNDGKGNGYFQATGNQDGTFDLNIYNAQGKPVQLLAKGRPFEEISQRYFTNMNNGLIKQQNDRLQANGQVIARKQTGGYTNTTGYLPGSPTANNPYNIIPSSNITMQNVPHLVLGIGDNGQQIMMQPGQNYNFGGAKKVMEIPMKYKKGGTYEMTEAEVNHLKSLGYKIEIE